MNWNSVLFLIVPYAVVGLVIVATAYRLLYRPSTVSSLSSQILESRKLFWGSIPFHWGLVLVLAGHVLAVFLPRSITLWNAEPLRLYVLEASGLALGLWALGGGLVLSWRRYSDARVRAVTSPADALVLFLLVLSMVTGVLTAVFYAFGSSWFTAVFTPYLWSLATLRPRPELVADLPWLPKLHAFNFFLLLAAFPFTRLVHIITLPLGYLFRPWQIVIWVRRPSGGEAARR